jgi:hypothetical protein
MAPLLFYGVFAFLALWAGFWLVRLAVRYGTSDALRMNRDWLAPNTDRDRDSTAP